MLWAKLLAGTYGTYDDVVKYLTERQQSYVKVMQSQDWEKTLQARGAYAELENIKTLLLEAKRERDEVTNGRNNGH